MNKNVIILSIVFLTSVSGFAQSSGLGAGLVVGEPTGFSAKYWLSQTTALDGTVAWSFQNNGTLYLHADFLNHYFDIIQVESGKMPLYWGFGAKVVLAGDPILGGHVPLGIAYLFDNAPLDIFLEVRPGLNIFPSTQFDMTGGIGVRYYFDQ